MNTFSLTVVRENGYIAFTIVRPDATCITGKRETLPRVFEFFELDMKKWYDQNRINNSLVPS